MRRFAIVLVPLESGPGCGIVLLIPSIIVLALCFWMFNLAKYTLGNIFYPTHTVATTTSQWDSIGQPDWSPLDNRIAYVMNDNIFITDSNGNSVPNKIVLGTSPKWAPDGTRIAYAPGYGSKESYGVCIVVITTLEHSCFLDTTDSGNFPLEVIGYADDGLFPYPTLAWSPNGKQIAYLCGAKDDSTFVHTCVLDTETGKSTMLSNYSFGDIQTWTAQGVIFRGGSIMKTDGTSIRGGNDVPTGSLSPNGKTMIFLDGDSLKEYDVSSKTTQWLKDIHVHEGGNAVVEWISWSSDGTQIAYVDYDPSTKNGLIMVSNK
ncbi:hypothetical protein C5B42_01825 [Candidatus Cerribacteria bacterium 'Amazon FNV 2010 28 9']|uniref:Dipeptidylpeptidase IV N-terminal domain-containing protein n=1 Tax=Candidatus Cerribacteria bacterium 'Amazon FNV 2010 28 9' TaxID=2081795 RepID=A0A317JQC3_9BACT|nr:MAG: hypothetical protein C5B42_01825 [Candidatus Cerribacteria bacterium 'Amazon FNV 2010 28 9']